MPEYIFQGKFAFLTYAQADIASDDLHAFLHDKEPIERAVICREHHSDNGLHTHAAIHFRRRFTTRRTDFFDFDGHHPNIQRVRSWGASVNYCRKDDGDQISYYGCTAEDAVDRRGEEGLGSQAIAAASAATSRLEWLSWCIDHQLAFAYAEQLWRQFHGAQAPTIFERENGGGVIGGILHQMRAHERVTVVCGPSGVGKTTWAKREATLPTLFVTDIDDLGHFDPAIHQSIIFDECRFNGDTTEGRRKGKWPLTAQIKLITWDDPVSIRIRYKIASIPRHIQKIITCTDTYPFTQDRQIERRIHIIDLYTDLTVNRWD